MFIAKDRRCSWHFHELKDEVFFVYRGAIEVYHSNEDLLESADMTLLGPGEKFHVPRGMRHQMVALADTELFEFSTQHFDSDSIDLLKEINEKYYIDIDGTIYTPTVGRGYELAEPFPDRIASVNEMFDQGHYMISSLLKSDGSILW